MQILQQRLANEGKVDMYIRVRPHASRSRFVRMLDDGSIKLDIAAPAEGGKGNAEVCRFVADMFSVPVASVRILSGGASRLKLVRIQIS